MRTAQAARANGPVARVITRHRDRLLADSRAFTEASLALAKRTADGSTALNAPTRETSAALTALKTWRTHVHNTRAAVQLTPAGAVGRAAATRWLVELEQALVLTTQALSLTDPASAADAGKRAHAAFSSAHRLRGTLDKAIG